MLCFISNLCQARGTGAGRFTLWVWVQPPQQTTPAPAGLPREARVWPSSTWMTRCWTSTAGGFGVCGSGGLGALTGCAPSAGGGRATVLTRLQAYAASPVAFVREVLPPSRRAVDRSAQRASSIFNIYCVPHPASPRALCAALRSFLRWCTHRLTALRPHLLLQRGILVAVYYTVRYALGYMKVWRYPS